MPVWLFIKTVQPYLVLLLHFIELLAMIQRMGGARRFKRMAVRYAHLWRRTK